MSSRAEQVLAFPPAPPAAEADPSAAVEAARRSLPAWSALPVKHRLRVIRAIRHRIAEDPWSLTDSVGPARDGSAGDALASEVLPLADACRFLELEAPRLLAPRKPSRRSRPLWLLGTRLQTFREPWGVVLIIGAGNYPLLLPGVQMIQALAAGNVVVLKPGRSGLAAAEALCALVRSAGAPDGVVRVLDEGPASASTAIEAGVDKVLLTGSHETGRSVLRRLAETVTPAVLELSGCDAVFVRDDADLSLTVAALGFGMRLNGSATCIAPRRVFVHRSKAAELEQRLAREWSELDPVPLSRDTAGHAGELVREAIERGARLVAGRAPSGGSMRPVLLADTSPEMAVMRSDVFAPVLSLVSVESDEQALDLSSRCPFQLGASVFGAGPPAARLASRIPAGVVVINDMIVPTADPRAAFGGRGASGFGVTRGAEGLLELTRPKVVIQRRGFFRPHLWRPGGPEEVFVPAILRTAHAAGLAERARAFPEAVRQWFRRSRTRSGYPDERR